MAPESLITRTVRKEASPQAHREFSHFIRTNNSKSKWYEHATEMYANEEF